jgi:spermidine dehydrogenase
MLGPGGFDAQRDILAITVNRWSHGYAWGTNTLVDDWDEHESIIKTARRRVGGVTIANSDSAWSAYAHSAIDQARRAVDELPAE